MAFAVCSIFVNIGYVRLINNYFNIRSLCLTLCRVPPVLILIPKIRNSRTATTNNKKSNHKVNFDCLFLFLSWVLSVCFAHKLNVLMLWIKDMFENLRTLTQKLPIHFTMGRYISQYYAVRMWSRSTQIISSIV